MLKTGYPLFSLTSFKYIRSSLPPPPIVVVVADDPAREGMLSTEDTWAIILSLSITIIIVSAVAFYLWRGNRRLKKARAEEVAARSRTRNNHDGAKVGIESNKCSFNWLQLEIFLAGIP